MGKVKGQGHSKSGLIQKLNLLFGIFGDFIDAFFKFGMKLDPIGT